MSVYLDSCRTRTDCTLRPGGLGLAFIMARWFPMAFEGNIHVTYEVPKADTARVQKITKTVPYLSVGLAVDILRR